MKDLYLSPTSILRYETCPRQADFYRRGWRANWLSDTMHFGNAAHQALQAFHQADPFGRRVDLPALFRDAFLAPLEHASIRYGCGRDKDSLLATGTALMEQYPHAWAETGLHALVDQAGPVVERKYTARIPGAGVVLVAKIDLAALDAAGRVFVIDHKTPGQDHRTDFTPASDQLLAYQPVFEAHAHEHGVERIDGLGIHALVRRKVATSSKGKGPVVAPIDVIPRRSDQDVAQYLEKVADVASDIRAGRCHKRSLHEHNSPCGLCEYAAACAQGDYTDLVNIKDPQPSEAAEAPEREAA